MAETFRVGIVGAGWAGFAHARGYAQAGGYKLDSVCDLIPGRLEAFSKEFSGVRVAESAEALIRDPGVDVVSLCLPTDLHGPLAVKALRAGKHVVVETPPAVDARAMRAMLRSAEKAREAGATRANKSAPKPGDRTKDAPVSVQPKGSPVLLPAFQRSYGAHESAARQAIEKGYAGEVYHVRAAWHRPGGIPQGARGPGENTGWYVDPARAGGGAMMDLGLHMLELGWSLLGYARPETVMAVGHRRLAGLGVEEAGYALLRFEGGRTMEWGSAWALRMPPAQYGLACRAHGTEGSVDVYTPHGATLYRGPAEKPKASVLKGPKVTHYAAMMRHLKVLAAGKGDEDALAPARRALSLMQIMEAVYRSIESGKSAEVRGVETTEGE